MGMREGETERWAVPTFEGTALGSVGDKSQLPHSSS